MVEIKINTNTASKEEIKKTIEFLKRFVGEDSYSNTQTSPPSVAPGPSSGNDFPANPSTMDIFGNSDLGSTKDDDPAAEEDDDDSDIQIKPIFSVTTNRVFCLANPTLLR